MRIVRALPSDVPRFMECAREFTQLLGTPLNEHHYGEAWRKQLVAGTGVVLMIVDEQDRVCGGIGGIRTIDFLSGEPQAVELFWYVKEDYRKGLLPVRLLTGFEQWAKEQGCVHVCMIYMEKSQPQKMKTFYERKQYALLESVYRKKL